MAEVPQIATRIALTGADDVNAEFERIRRSGEASLGALTVATNRNLGTVEAGIKRNDVAVQGGIANTTASTGILSRAVSALGDAANFVSDKIASIAVTAGIAGGGLTAALTAGYFALDSFATASAEEGDKMLRFAKGIDTSVEALTRWQYMADIASGSSDAVEGSFKKLFETIHKANEGDAKANDLFSALDISIYDKSGKLKGVEAVLGDIERQFRKIPTPALQARAAMELFGKGGDQMLPILQREASSLAALQKEAKELGETKTSDLTDNTKLLEGQRRLKAAIETLKESVASAFFPVFAEGANATADWLNKRQEQFGEWAETAAETFKNFKEDVGKLFSEPLSERVTFLSLDNKEIDLKKQQLRNLVQVAKDAKQSLSDDEEDEDGEEGGGGKLIDLDRKEIEHYVEVAGKRVELDNYTQEHYVELDGKRVALTKANNGTILKSLGEYAESALDALTSQNAKAMRFKSDWMAALYEPIQGLKRLGLDLWDALSGKGLGKRTQWLQDLIGWFDAAGGAVIEFGRAVLATFGQAVGPIPTFTDMLNYAKDSFRSFRQALSGDEEVKVGWAGKVGAILREIGLQFTAFKNAIFGDQSMAQDYPWATRFGAAINRIATSLSYVQEPVKSAGAWLLDLAGTAIEKTIDALSALWDVINRRPIANNNSFAWMNKYVDDLGAAFTKIKDTVVDASVYIYKALGEPFKNWTWEDWKKLAIDTFNDLQVGATKAFTGMMKPLNDLIATVKSLEPFANRVAKAFGFENWKQLGFALFVGYLLSQTGIPGVIGKLGDLAMTVVQVVLGAFIIVGAGIAAAFGLPVIAVLAVEAALIALAVAAYVYWDQIKAGADAARTYVEGKWSDLSTWWEANVAGPVRNAATWDNVGKKAEEARTEVQSKWSTFASWFVEIFTDPKKANAEFWDVVTDRQVFAWGSMKDTWGGLKDLFQDPIATIKKWFDELWTGIENRAKGAWASVKSVLGFGGDGDRAKSPYDDITPEETGAGWSPPKERGPSNYVLDGGVWRESAADEFTGPAPVIPAPMDVLRDLVGGLKGVFTPGGVGSTVFSGPTPPVAPSGAPGMAGMDLVPFELTVAARQGGGLFGTPGAIQDLVRTLQDADIAVKTDRPRTI